MPNNRNCCCCGACPTFTDYYYPNDPAGRDPLPVGDYTQQSSTWSWVMSGPTKLEYIKPDSVGATFTLTNKNRWAQILRVWWRQYNLEPVRIIQNWKDSNNYAYLLADSLTNTELTANIYKVVSGTPTLVAGPQTFTSVGVGSHLLWVGYCKNYMQVIGSQINDEYLSGNVGDTTGDLCGLQATDTDFQLDQVNWSGCISSGGTSGKARMIYQIDIHNAGDPPAATPITTEKVYISGAPGQTPTVYAEPGDATGNWWLTFDWEANLMRVYKYLWPATIVEYRGQPVCFDLTTLDKWELAWYSGTSSGTVARVSAVTAWP